MSGEEEPSPKRIGPKITTKMSCHGCAHVRSRAYMAGADAGFDVWCTFGVIHRDVGDSVWTTPSWCPVLPALPLPETDFEVRRLRMCGARDQWGARVEVLPSTYHGMASGTDVNPEGWTVAHRPNVNEQFPVKLEHAPTLSAALQVARGLVAAYEAVAATVK